MNKAAEQYSVPRQACSERFGSDYFPTVANNETLPFTRSLLVLIAFQASSSECEIIYSCSQWYGHRFEPIDSAGTSKMFSVHRSDDASCCLRSQWHYYYVRYIGPADMSVYVRFECAVGDEVWSGDSRRPEWRPEPRPLDLTTLTLYLACTIIRL